MLIKLSILLLLSISCVVSQGPSCNYTVHATLGYTCAFYLVNPNGYDNFTHIDGAHVAGKTDEDVMYVTQDFGIATKNLPRIICDQFPNIVRMTFKSTGLQSIGEFSLRGCKYLSILSFSPNNIKEIHEDAFIENVRLTSINMDLNQLKTLPSGVFRYQFSLETLQLQRNRIENFPPGVFNSMTRLTNLNLNNNYLEILHSDSFGLLPYLNTFSISSNNINAMNEDIIEYTGIQIIYAGPNPCINGTGNYTDTTYDRRTIRNALGRCFEYYEEREEEIETTIGTTTPWTITYPYDCGTGNLCNRVYHLETENQAMSQQIEAMREEFTSELNLLRDKILEISTNCGCS